MVGTRSRIRDVDRDRRRSVGFYGFDTRSPSRGLRVELFEARALPAIPHRRVADTARTYWVLKRLNMLDTMKGSHFVRKYSVQFIKAYGHSSRSRSISSITSRTNRRRRGRSRRERIRSCCCCNNARKHGVAVHEGARVLEVLFEGARAVGVASRSTRRQSSARLRCQVVIGRQRAKLDDH